MPNIKPSKKSIFTLPTTLQISTRQLTVAFLCISGIAYLPFLVATQYLYPLGIHEWDFISQWYGLVQDGNFWTVQEYMYQNMMGRFYSTAILSTLPYWYSLDTFRLFALVDLLLIPFSLWYLLRSIFSPQAAWLSTAFMMLLYLQQITNLFDSLLRFTCMPIYHFGLIGSCFSLGLLLRHVLHDKPYWYLLAAFMIGGMVIGTNEISMLQYVISVGLILFIHYSKSSSKVTIIAGSLFLLVCVGIALLAPGNFNRALEYEGSLSLVNSIALSIATSCFLWIKWLSDSLIIPVSILVILLSKNVQFFKEPSTSKKAIKWLIAGLIVLVPASLFPLLYGTGGLSLPERVVDLIFFVMATLWLILLMALMDNFNQPQNLSQQNMPFSILTIGLCLYITFHLFADGLKIDRQKDPSVTSKIDLIEVESNVGKAWHQLINGTYANYKKETALIDQEVKECKKDTCLVPPLQTVSFIGYDPLYDRLHKGGDTKMGVALGNRDVKVVKYRE